MMTRECCILVPVLAGVDARLEHRFESSGQVVA